MPSSQPKPSEIIEPIVVAVPNRDPSGTQSQILLLLHPESPARAFRVLRERHHAVSCLVLACLSWFFGPLSAIPAIILGHAVWPHVQRDEDSALRRAALLGLFAAYASLISFIVVVYLAMICAITSLTFIESAAAGTAWYWFASYVMFGFLLWFHTVATKPKFGKYLTVCLLIGAAFFTLGSRHLLESRSAARRTLAGDRLRQIGVFMQQRSDNHNGSAAKPQLNRDDS